MTEQQTRLEVRGTISYAKHRLKIVPPQNFRSAEQLIKYLNDTMDAELGDDHGQPRLGEEYVRFLITNKIIIARQLDPVTGEIRPITGASANATPPVIGNTTGDRAQDAALEAGGGQVAYANTPHTRLGHNPENLKNKSLDELNGMALAEAEETMTDQGVFTDINIARAFLSSNFKTPAPLPNPNA